MTGLRHGCAAACAPLLATLAMTLTANGAAAATPAPTPVATPAPTPNPHAGEAWWVPVGLRGQRITTVVASGDRIIAVAGGTRYTSIDGGATFTATAQAPRPSASCSLAALTGGSPTSPPDAEVAAGRDHWSLCAGRVLHADGPYPDAVPKIDLGSPNLGAGARLIAASAASPTVVVAISDDNTVWRRSGRGDWNRVLVLLPQNLVQGAPTVTAVTAFDQPLTDTIYLATDGYSVLISRDSGDDWIRAGPGLPDSVLALTSDSRAQAVYAGTGDGIWVHHLQPIPAAPAYLPDDLKWRQWGTALVTLLGSVAALVLLRRLVSAPPP